MLPKGFPIVMLEGSIGTLLGAAFGILCARYWGPEFGGIASLAITLAGLFSFISCLSIEQIVIARYVGASSHETIFLATMVIRLVAIGLSTCGVALSSQMMDVFSQGWVLLPMLAFFQMALSALDLWRLRSQALILLHHQAKPRILIAATFFMAKSACLFLQTPELSVWSTLWLAVAETSLLLTVSIATTRAVSPLEIVRPFDWDAIRSQAKDILAASLPFFAAGVIVMLFFKLDYLLLGELASARDLGLYASAMRILEMYLGLANLALLQIYPIIARNHGISQAAYTSSLRMAFRFAYAAAAAIVVFNYLVGETVILALLGASYAEVARYSTIFCLLAIPLLSGTVRGFAISLDALHANHLYAALIGFAISIPLLLTLIPQMGFRGALVADLAAYTASAMLSSFLLPSLRRIARIQWRPGFH